MSGASAQVHVDVADVSVVFHCEHADDTASFKVEHDGTDVTVYLNGTAEQLSLFAVAVSAAVAQWCIDLVADATRKATA